MLQKPDPDAERPVTSMFWSQDSIGIDKFNGAAQLEMVDTSVSAGASQSHLRPDLVPFTYTDIPSPHARPHPLWTSQDGPTSSALVANATPLTGPDTSPYTSSAQPINIQDTFEDASSTFTSPRPIFPEAEPEPTSTLDAHSPTSPTPVIFSPKPESSLESKPEPDSALKPTVYMPSDSSTSNSEAESETPSPSMSMPAESNLEALPAGPRLSDSASGLPPPSSRKQAQVLSAPPALLLDWQQTALCVHFSQSTVCLLGMVCNCLGFEAVSDWQVQQS